MAVAIVWKGSASASCLHAAAALVHGRMLVDAAIVAALAEPLAHLVQELPNDEPLRERCWDHLTALAANVPNNRSLASMTLAKALGRGAVDAERELRLAGCLDALENAFARVHPDVEAQLALRGEPLRQLWEARGPGLLATVGRLTEADLIVEHAEVILVHPALGGSGTAHLLYNSVRIEAVLVNVQPALPEVARLGWLLSQLHQDVPRYSESIPQGRLNRVAALAMLPPALMAAEEVELATYSPATLKLALEAWNGEPTAKIEPLAEALGRWWGTYRAARPRWAVALAALDALLAEHEDDDIQSR